MDQNKKLMIVDDDPFIVELYVLKFKSAGFEVEVARNGKEGLELAKKFMPDLVLLDLVMPVMTGFDFLENAKSDPQLKDIPVIAFTNRFSMEEESRARTLGASDYLIKIHFTPEELVTKIGSFLSQPPKK